MKHIVVCSSMLYNHTRIIYGGVNYQGLLKLCEMRNLSISLNFSERLVLACV